MEQATAEPDVEVVSVQPLDATQPIRIPGYMFEGYFYTEPH